MKKGLFALCLLCMMVLCMVFSAHGETDAFSQPSGQLNMELAMQAARLCEVSYSTGRLRELLEDMGYDTDAIVHQDYTTDALHSAAMTISHRQMKDAAGKQCTVYAIVVRGTMTGQEMISNFMVGEGDISFGFQQAAERAYGHFADYMAQFPPAANGEYKVWVTGHSRGAAVANLLAGEYLPQHMKKEQIYGYTFATPNVQKTVDSEAPVYNFILDGDVVTRVPPAEWDYKRHGTDIHCDQAMIGDIAITSKRDTDRLMRTILMGGLTKEAYQTNIEPMLSSLSGNDNAENMSYTTLLLPLLQNIDQSTAEDKMNLTEILAFTQRILPSHTMETYIAWLETMK